MEYIHFGHDKFEKEKFEKVENIPELTKAKGGFWGCRKDSNNDWKSWCESNEFECDFTKQIVFSLKEEAKVLTIEKCEQLKDLPKQQTMFASKVWSVLDFEKLSEQYDAIEVLISKDHQLYFDLYGWDCDSIFIMNPDVVVPK